MEQSYRYNSCFLRDIVQYYRWSCSYLHNYCLICSNHYYRSNHNYSKSCSIHSKEQMYMRNSYYLTYIDLHHSKCSCLHNYYLTCSSHYYMTNHMIQLLYSIRLQELYHMSSMCCLRDIVQYHRYCNYNCSHRYCLIVHIHYYMPSHSYSH